MDGVDFPRVRTTGPERDPIGRFLISDEFSPLRQLVKPSRPGMPHPALKSPWTLWMMKPTSLFVNETSEMKVIRQGSISQADDGDCIIHLCRRLQSAVEDYHRSPGRASMGRFPESYAPTYHFYDVADTRRGRRGGAGVPGTSGEAAGRADIRPIRTGRGGRSRAALPLGRCLRRSALIRAILQKVLAQVNGMPDRDARLKRLRGSGSAASG